MDADEFLEFDFDIGCESFQRIDNINNFECEARESLGLLRPSILTFMDDFNEDFIEIRRESMPCIDTEQLKSRESLGVLNSNLLRTLNISVDLLNDSVFYGDEHNSSKGHTGIPEITIETSETSNQDVSSLLNTNFVPHQSAATLRKSTCDSLADFALLKSTLIYSIPHISSEPDDSLISKFKRLRMQSLPTILEQAHETETHIENACKTEQKSEGAFKEDDFNKFLISVEAAPTDSRIADGTYIRRESIMCVENSFNFEWGVNFENTVGNSFAGVNRESILCTGTVHKFRVLHNVVDLNSFSMDISTELLDDSVFVEDAPGVSKRHLNVPTIFVEISETSCQYLLSPLNTAFLRSWCSAASRKSSTFTCSSPSSFLSLQSETSPIYSVSHNSKFNNANFFETSSDVNGADNSLGQFSRLRVGSLPAVLQQIGTAGNHIEDEWNADAKSETALQEDFRKLAFVAEAEHIASTIADGSIFETSYGEVILLDSIPQPEWEEILKGAQENSLQKIESVFKQVDKLLPMVKQVDDSAVNIINNQDVESGRSGDVQENSVCDFNVKTSTSRNSSTGTSSLSRNDFLQNLSNVFDLQRLSMSQASHCSDKSKSSRDAKDILRNLSEIFKTENRSSEQQAEGQNLIMCLADMLCTEKSKGEDTSEDSGHSLVETDDVQKCNATKSGINRRLSQSFSFLDKKQESPKTNKNFNENVETLKMGEGKRNRSMSVSAIEKRNFKKLPVGRNSMAGPYLSKPSSLGKLKPRRSEEAISSKKGPLKAVIPLVRMSKVKSHGESTKSSTPPKMQVPSKKKCSSTPIEEFKLHPVAQSTPGSGGNKILQSPKSSSQTGQRKFDYSVSPLSTLNAPRNTSGNKINHSGSEPNLSEKIETMPSKIHRRRSANDLKNEMKPMILKRSHSIDKDDSVMIAREKANILKANNASRIAVHKSRDSLSAKSTLKSITNIKPFNLMSNLRANGKENAGR